MPGKLIVVLAAIALLFVLGVSCGALQDDNTTVGDARGGWVQTLNDLIGRKPSVNAGDLSSGVASCRQNEQLRIAPQGGACGYVIGSDDRAVRDLSLRLIGGSSATIAVQQDDFNDSAQLTGGHPDESFDLLPGDPATVVITCSGNIPCTLIVD